MKVRCWNKLESFVSFEEQLWPDCGRPSNIFLPRHTVRGGKATQTYSFLGLGLNSSQPLTFQKFLHSVTVVASLVQVHGPGQPAKARVQGRVQGVQGGLKVSGTPSRPRAPKGLSRARRYRATDLRAAGGGESDLGRLSPLGAA